MLMVKTVNSFRVSAVPDFIPVWIVPNIQLKCISPKGFRFAGKHSPIHVDHQVGLIARICFWIGIILDGKNPQCAGFRVGLNWIEFSQFVFGFRTDWQITIRIMPDSHVPLPRNLGGQDKRLKENTFEILG